MGNAIGVEVAGGSDTIRQSFSLQVVDQSLVADDAQRINVEIKDVSLASLNAGASGRGAN